VADEKLDVLVICGSLRKGSYNSALARTLPALAPAGMTVRPAPSFEKFPIYNHDIQDTSGFPAEVNAWADAIRNYQEALRLNPADVDAKRNLELALLQMQEEKKKQQQQQQQDDKNEDQQDKQQPQPKDQKGSPQDSPKPEPREQKTPGGEKERISREEANRILDAMKEQDRPPKDQIKAPPPDKKPEKDW